MKHTKLGNTGISISKLALGTMYFGDETSQEDAFAIMDAYVEAGGNFIDTANVYVGGVAEQIVGRWFADRPKDVTDRIVLATKGRSGRGEDPNAVGLSRRHLHRALDASLARLGVDVVDLYQLHASDMHTPVEETLSFLSDAVQAGKIHYFGLSNFTGWQIQLFASTAKSMGIQIPASIQQQYSLLSRENEWEVIPAALHNAMSVLPWSPLAGGFLSGKYQRGGDPASGTRAGSEKALYQWTSEEYANSDRNWATIDMVVNVAREHAVTPSQVALSWIGNRPGVAAPIFGARDLKQLQDNLGAVEISLDQAAADALESVSRPTPGGYPYGAFGRGQRNRDLKDGNPAPGLPVAGGSKHPLGLA